MFRVPRVAIVSAIGAALVASSLAVAPASAVATRTIWIADNNDTKLTTYPATDSVGTATGCPKDNKRPTYVGVAGLKNAVDTAQAGDEIRLCNTSSNLNDAPSFDLSKLPANIADPFAQTLRIRVPLTIMGATSSSNRGAVISGGGVTRPFVIDAAAQAVTLRGLIIENGFALGIANTTCLAGGQCGGAIKITAGQLTLKHSVLRNNVAGFAGGAIALTSSTGAILNLETSAFLNNTSNGDGAAIVDSGDNTVSISNVTFSENFSSSGTGAAVASALGLATLNHVTAMNNGAAGSVLSGSGVTVTNSILGQRTGSTPACDANVKLGTGNLITDSSCIGASQYQNGSVDSSSIVTFGQLRLGRLFVPAGVPYFRPLTDSPALNFITPGESDPTYDVTGALRPSALNTRSDSGAFERQANLSTRTRTSALSYPQQVNLARASHQMPFTDAVFTPSAAHVYASLTPEVCSIQDAQKTIGRVELNGPGTCIIETYIKAGSSAGIDYEEVLNTTSFRVFEPTKPSIPRNMLVIASEKGFKVSWQSPADDGGSPITDYALTVRAKVGDFEKTVKCGLVSPCTINGLDSDIAFAVTISVANEGGFVGVYNVNKSIKTVATAVPTSPLSPYAKGAKASANVKWAAPRSVGKTALKNYVVRVYAPTNLNRALFTKVVKATVRSTTVTKLKRRTPYVVRIFAVNSNGSSLPSAPISITTL